MSHRAVICIGSNTPDADSLVTAAEKTLADIATVKRCSERYTSPDDTGRGADYLNMVMMLDIDTDTDLATFRSRLAEIERELGRTPESKPSAVMPMDIDVVIWDNRVVSPYDFKKPYFRNGFNNIHY